MIERILSLEYYEKIIILLCGSFSMYILFLLITR